MIPNKLSSGAHENPKDGACIMEVASLLAKESWSDLPNCTNEVIARHAQYVNDKLGDEDRQRLWAFLPRLIRCRRTDSDQKINVRLAIWAARKVEHLIREQDRAVASAALKAAEDWVADPDEENAANAAANAANAANAYAAAHAAYADSLIDFLDELLDQWELAAKAEDEDIYVPREWEDDALKFCAEMLGDAEASV